jgi:hypothetical protein
VALETASYVANLQESNPDGLDQRSTADNHLRLIKAALKRTFPKMDGPVSLSAAQVMYLGDLSASVQLQLNQLRDGSATANNALYANSASYAANAGNAIAVGGFSHSDVAVLARTIDQTFAGAVIIKATGSIGSVGLRTGSTSYPGYVEYKTPDGTRRGFIGFGNSNNRLQIVGENNWGWDFSGSVAPAYNGNLLLHTASSLPAPNLSGAVPNACIPLSAVQQHQASLSVGSASTATTATTAGNANTVGGYAPSESATGGTVAARTSNGYLYAAYFNQSSPAEAAAVDHVITTQGDAFFRKITLANFGAQLQARNITGRTGTAKNLAAGSGPPSLSGSTNGDLFYYY